MKRLGIAALFVLAFAVVAIPAAATSQEPIGTQFRLIVGTQTTFAAGTPFNIQQGWALDPLTTDAIGKFSFALEVDGTFRAEDFVLRTVTSGTEPLLRLWVFNFPFGMSAGTHTFIGHWLGPCQALLNFGYIPGPCSSPNAVVEVVQGFSRSLTVTFS